MDNYYTDDITFCMNRRCKTMECERNPKHIKSLMRPHSFAEFENTEYCQKEKKENVKYQEKN